MVEADAERGEVAVLLPAQRVDGEAADGLDVGQIVAVPLEVVARDLADVVAAVAVLGELAGLAQQLLRARAHRDREVLDLLAGVVVVELARDVCALPFEQPGDRIAERRLAAVPDVQRTGGVGRDELDHDALAGEGLAAAECVALRQDIAHDGLSRGRREEHVDESRAGDLGALDQRRGRQRSHDGLRQLTRIASRGLCQHQRDVRRVVAVRGLLRPLDGDRPRLAARQRRTHAGGEPLGNFEAGIVHDGGVDKSH